MAGVTLPESMRVCLCAGGHVIENKCMSFLCFLTNLPSPLQATSKPPIRLSRSSGTKERNLKENPSAQPSTEIYFLVCFKVQLDSPVAHPVQQKRKT